MELSKDWGGRGSPSVWGHPLDCTAKNLSSVLGIILALFSPRTSSWVLVFSEDMATAFLDLITHNVFVHD